MQDSVEATTLPRPRSHESHVRITQLTKRFGAFTALQSVSLDIARGEFVCFLGPSGCGKTTLLRTIAGLDFQDEGTIELAGRDVSRLPPAKRDFGIVFQSYALFPNLSVAANVGYGLVNQRRTRAERLARVTEMLDLVGLADQAAKYPAQLSGGQQQRVALARALATGPNLLLLDEPLSALDARVRLRLRDEIKSLQRRLGVTTIMVTHDQEEAMAMSDRIVVMNHGRIEQIGSPADVYARPDSAFVADFVGTMNFVDARVVGPGQVELAGVPLVVATPLAAPIGSHVRLGFRPEDVQIGVLADEQFNRMSMRVELLDYVGSYCRATLHPAVAAEPKFLADISANIWREQGVVEGQMIDISLPSTCLHVFEASAHGPDGPITS